MGVHRNRLLLVAGLLLAGVAWSGSARALTSPSEPAPSLAAAAPDAFPHPAVITFLSSPPPAAAPWHPERSEFSLRPGDPLGDPGTSVVQRARYLGEGKSFSAEMGDLSIDESPGTLSDLTRRGARFSLSRATGSGVAELSTFAFTGGHPADNRSVLVGATGSLSLLGGARVRTIFASGKEMLEPENRRSDGAARGDVLGVVATVDPFGGRLQLEAEADYAVFDGDSGDGVPAVQDLSCRARLGGGAAGYRYAALYERTGPRYHVIGGSAPRRDWEGYAVTLGKDLGLHALDLRLSRHNDNLERSPLSATLYRYEGTVDYSFKALETLPLGVQYRKRLSSVRQAEGGGRGGVDEDTLTGRLDYLVGEWNLGVRASYLQRTDISRDEKDLTATTLALAPRYSAGGISVAPDFSLKRSCNLLDRQRTDEYWAGVDLRGNALDRQLDYQVRGGFRTILTDPAAARNRSLGAHVRLAYPLKGIFRALSAPTLGVRGEYNGLSDTARRERNYSFLLVLEGR